MAEQQKEQTNTSYTATELTEAGPPKKFWLRLLLIGIGGALLGMVSLVAVTLFLDGTEGFISGDEASAKDPVKSPPSATEIIADELSGKIVTAEVDPESLTQPQPTLPTTAELESRDLEDEFTGGADEKKADRKVASVDKSPVKLHIDKAGSKISKNLDRKKVMGLLTKKLDNSCQPKLPPDTKTVKAEMKISNTGSIANIKVTPSSAESELAKCMRKKLVDTKALKPKDKALAKITVQFKLK